MIPELSVTCPIVVNREEYVICLNINNFDMRKYLMILAAAACLYSCNEKESPVSGSFEALVEEMCGEYVLSGMHWTGTPIDLNGDGTGYNDLIQELCCFNGYYEPNHYAEVAVSDIEQRDDDKTISVSVMLPYPDFLEKDGKTYIAGVGYLPFTLRETYIGGDTSVALTYGPVSFDQVPDEEIFLKGITELRITDFKDREFTVRVRCHMKEADKTEYRHEYLNYYYRKLN